MSIVRNCPTVKPASSAGCRLPLVLLLPLTFGCNPAPKPTSVQDSSQAIAATTPSVSAWKPATLPRPPSEKPRAARPDDWFEDVTERSGVSFRYRNGMEGKQFTILETVGGGVALLDYDQDGKLDLFFPGGGQISEERPGRVTGLPGALFHNDGNWHFTDVTAEAGLAAAGDYTHGVAVADYDRNGFPDLFVTAFGRCRLFRNEGGKFTDVTQAAGLDFVGWSTAAVWADIDHDGYPDLYVAEYLDWDPARERVCGDPERGIREVCAPMTYPPRQHRLFRNRGDGTFEDLTDKVQLARNGRGLGVVALDLNDDGWIDFYVANDAGAKHLYWGQATYPWQEAALWAGVAYNEFGLPTGSMGVDAADYDGDGRPDLFLGNFELEDNDLYHNEGHGSFRHVTVAAGLAGPCFPYITFGAGFADFDSDGWEDLFVLNGSVFYALGQSPYYQPSFVFRNLAGKRFADVSAQAGPYFGVRHVARGGAVGDLDNDGALDLVIVHQNDPVTLLRNRLTPPRWVRVQLRGVSCDREAVGAKVWATYQGRTLYRWIRGGAGYLSQFDQRLTFPVDADGPVTVFVRWPGGPAERFAGLELRRTHDLVQGRGQRLDGKEGTGVGNAGMSSPTTPGD